MKAIKGEYNIDAFHNDKPYSMEDLNNHITSMQLNCSHEGFAETVTFTKSFKKYICSNCQFVKMWEARVSDE